MSTQELAQRGTERKAQPTAGVRPRSQLRRAIIRLPMILLGLILCGLLSQGLASGAELVIHFTTVQRALARQVFTQDGRKYLRGTPAAKCSYAYLQDPKVGADGGLLNVQARFSGRSALNVFGVCVGLGDAFDISIHALPYYQDGFLKLKNVRVEGKGRDGFYIRRVCAAMARSLQTQFSYRVLDEAKTILERKEEGAGYVKELARFQVPAVWVTSEAVVLSLDFALVVK
ncbi:MAG TPA: hypothetical protein PKJ41_16405 [Bryobacteraceae bacterium]|nr:hypothetical protein [Bryobacteraceae bacterium]